MDVARKNTLRMIITCCGIMDPYELDGEILDPCDPEDVTAAEIFYPCMQCAAVLFQKADIWLLAVDHQEVSMLTREYCKGIERDKKKPIILSQ